MKPSETTTWTSFDAVVSHLIANQAIERLLGLDNPLVVPAECPKYSDGKNSVMLYLLLRGTRLDWEQLENFWFWKSDTSNEKDDLDFFLMRAVADKIFGWKDTIFDANNKLTSRFEYQTLYQYTISRISSITTVEQNIAHRASIALQ